MVKVEDTLTDNMHHNYKCSPQPSYGVATTNSFEKLIPKSCRFKIFQPLACHDSVVIFRVENDHQQGHIVDYFGKKGQSENNVNL